MDENFSFCWLFNLIDFKLLLLSETFQIFCGAPYSMHLVCWHWRFLVLQVQVIVDKYTLIGVLGSFFATDLVDFYDLKIMAKQYLIFVMSCLYIFC